MSKKIALEAKEQGNAAFKAGDYPAAIGHYTRALLADGSDSTFALNRAAAYLKLGKHEDAERDCDRVLAAEPKNVKARFRRAQARAGRDSFDGAREDFRQVLVLDPANAAAKAELARVDGVLAKPKPAPRTTPLDVPVAPLPGSSAPRPKRRRVPITIVDDDDEVAASASTPALASSSGAALLTPVSSRPLGTATQSNKLAPSAKSGQSALPVPAPPPAPSVPSASTATPTPVPTPVVVSQSTTTTAPSPSPTPTPKPATFAAAKQARATRSVGGGIFRASGQHTVVGTDGAVAPVPVPSPAAESWVPKHALDEDARTPPMSVVMFARAWASLSAPHKRWTLLTQIPPGALPALFQSALEPPLLGALLATLAAAPADDDTVRAWVRAYMCALPRVPRFRTLVLLLEPRELGAARGVVAALGGVEGWEGV